MSTLAATLVTALATKAFEKVGDKLGENILEKATDLIKGLFKPDEFISLNLSAEHLSNPLEQGILIGRLEDRLTDKPDIAQQLQALIDKLNASSDAEIITRRVSKDSDVKSEIQTTKDAKGDDKILTEDIESSRVTSTIKRT